MTPGRGPGASPAPSREGEAGGTESLELAGSERIDSVNARLGTSLSSAFFDTIAGFVMERLDDVPSVGRTVREQGFAFTVAAMTGNRVDAIYISRAGEPQ